jgi:hypothetical protein
MVFLDFFIFLFFLNEQSIGRNDHSSFFICCPNYKQINLCRQRRNTQHSTATQSNIEILIFRVLKINFFRDFEKPIFLCVRLLDVRSKLFHQLALRRLKSICLGKMQKMTLKLLTIFLLTAAYAFAAKFSKVLTMSAAVPVVTIGTRGSPLALAQAYETKRLLGVHFPELAVEGAVEVKKIMTKVIKFNILKFSSSI